MNILFVCAGNTCRSPMAEAMMKKKVAERGLDYVSCTSAGTHVWPGDKASADTVSEMASRGIDLEGRPAQQLNADLVSQADVILTMTEGVSQAVWNLFPDATGKVSTLGDYVGVSGDVDDPYGCDELVYHSTAEQIDGLLNKLADKLA